MITKEQAMNLKVGDSIYQHFKFTSSVTTEIKEVSPPNRWKINGKVQTWKTRPGEFKVPIKYGLYNFGYLTEENSHLFETSIGN